MPKVRRTDDKKIIFCPGCQCAHGVNDRWSFNGDMDKPTFSPSILVTTGHYISEHKGDCWCNFNDEQLKKGEKPSGFNCGVCHSFVTDGKIQFLNDCTHSMAGQTLDLPDVE